MTAYYNEIDPAAVAVLRHLISDGVIAPGEVDTRSIKEVQPDDLRGFTQCHFFAGGGLWSLACRMAGWSDARPIWTGSCPCQPFSAAGKGGGTDDPRHLWPDFHRLIRACRPAVVMGEQVAGAAGYGWFDGVRADLEREGYAGRAVDFPACAVDAPHQRNRLYWCAVGSPTAAIARQSSGERCFALGRSDVHVVGLVDAEGFGRGEGRAEPIVLSGRPTAPSADAPSVNGECPHRASPIGDAERAGLEGFGGHGDIGGRSQQGRPVASPDVGERGHVALGDGDDQGRLQPEGSIAEFGGRSRDPDERRNGTHWSDAEWIICHDGKARRAFTAVRSLAYGLPGSLATLGHDSFVHASEEVISYANATENRPKTVLRALWDGVLSAQTGEAQRRQWSNDHGLGSAEGFCSSQVLLTYLCELDRRVDESGCLFTIDPKARRAMRSVRGHGEPPLPPCGRADIQQPGQKPANSLRELSHVLARYAEAAGQAVGATDAKGMGLLIPSYPGRIDLWKVSGNAIVPEAAVEAISALMDVIDWSAAA